MKYLVLGSLCLLFSGCANTSNGGGWVVSNGMTDKDSAQEGMSTLQKDEGMSCGCGTAKGHTCESCSCGCDGHKAKKKKK